MFGSVMLTLLLNCFDVPKGNGFKSLSNTAARRPSTIEVTFLWPVKIFVALKCQDKKRKKPREVGVDTLSRRM